MNQQKKIIVAVSILAIVLIVALAIGINLMEKKPTGNNGVSTEDNSENAADVDTEMNAESIQGVESETEISQEMETESKVETTEKEEPEVVVPPTSETKEPEEVKPKWTVTDMNKTMYAKSFVNVRKGPGTEYDKLGSLSTNQEVKVTGKCNEFDWYRINYNGNEAYVSCSYLIDEKIVDNINNDTNNNPNNENNNSEEVQQPNNTEEEEEIVKVPTTPEPEWGTIKYEMPNDGWSYMPIHIWDNWDSEDNEWIREVRQTTFGHEEQDDWEVFEISEKAYPWRTDVGTEGQRIEYPTIWVYFGEGAEEW